MTIENITVPDLGDVNDVEVIELLVSVGQSVAENDSLLVLESDKAAMEIPAPMAGVVMSIAVNLGDQVTTGSEMLTLEVEDRDKPAQESVESDADPEQDTATKATEAEAPQVSDMPSNTAELNIIEVPDLGTDDEVDVIEIHVQTGDVVAKDDSLITLESDKAAMEIPSPQAGTIEAIIVAVGDKVKTGSPILHLLGGLEAPIDRPESVAVNDKEPAQQPSPATTEAANSQRDSDAIESAASPVPVATQSRVYAGPAVRKLARELGVDLQSVQGTGAKTRITKEDLQGFVKSRMNAPVGQAATVATIPDIDFSQFGEIEQIPRSKLHKKIAVNMHRNWTAIPHVAQFIEADVTDLENFRAELQPEAQSKAVKLTFLPFLLKTCAKALQLYPQFNVSLDSSGDYLVQKKYIHIGIAVATEVGLVVPVIRDVDLKTIWQLAAEVIELTEKAKQRKLSIDEMQGGCFTISSLGAIGGTGFIPIINAPEVAILGVAKTEMKPVYIDGEFIPRKMLPLTLSYDHKAVNGVDGGLFANYIAKLLADVRHILV